jgi:DNA-binding NarL/FixJ family response regulator
MLGRPLTVRETQIVRLVADAKLNKEIASELHLSEGTVKVFLGPIFAKTGVRNRTALAVWWILRNS